MCVPLSTRIYLCKLSDSISVHRDTSQYTYSYVRLFRIYHVDSLCYLTVVHSYVWLYGKLVDDDQKVAPVFSAYVCMDELKWSRCWVVGAERLCWL